LKVFYRGQSSLCHPNGQLNSLPHLTAERHAGRGRRRDQFTPPVVDLAVKKTDPEPPLHHPRRGEDAAHLHRTHKVHLQLNRGKIFLSQEHPAIGRAHRRIRERTDDTAMHASHGVGMFFTGLEGHHGQSVARVVRDLETNEPRNRCFAEPVRRLIYRRSHCPTGRSFEPAASCGFDYCPRLKPVRQDSGVICLPQSFR